MTAILEYGAFASVLILFGINFYMKWRKIQINKTQYTLVENKEKLTLFNQVINVLSNYDILTQDELKTFGYEMITNTLPGVGLLDTIENKELNKFIEYVIGTRPDFDMDRYKMNVIRLMNTLQDIYNQL